MWFSVQRHLTRFGLQEYAIVTGLKCGLVPKSDEFTKVMEKMILKDKYFKSLDKISCAQLENDFLRSSTPRADRYKLCLVLIVEGVFNALDNNEGIDIDTLSIIDNLNIFFYYPECKVGCNRLLRGFRGSWVRKFRETYAIASLHHPLRLHTLREGSRESRISVQEVC